MGRPRPCRSRAARASRRRAERSFQPTLQRRRSSRPTCASPSAIPPTGGYGLLPRRPRRPAPSGAVCSVRRRRAHRLRCMSRRSAFAPRAALRALRRADCLAGRALRGVLRPAARVLLGARGGRLRGAGPRRSSPRGRSEAGGGSRAPSPGSSSRSCRARRSTVLTFVPADPARGLWRGQNPAEALARLVALEWDLPVERLLERTRRRPAATRALARGSPQNVRGAFSGDRRASARRIR